MAPAKQKIHGVRIGALFLVFLSGGLAQQALWEQLVVTGNSSRQQGRYAEAERALLMALREAESVPAPDVALPTTLNNLALLYQDQGRYQEAERLYQRALDVWRKVFPQENNTTTLIRKNWQPSTMPKGASRRRSVCFLKYSPLGINCLDPMLRKWLWSSMT